MPDHLDCHPIITVDVLDIIGRSSADHRRRESTRTNTRAQQEVGVLGGWRDFKVNMTLPQSGLHFLTPRPGCCSTGWAHPGSDRPNLAQHKNWIRKV